EDFEKVLVNVFLALDYVHLGKWDDALVEARKVDHKLTVLADRNQKRMTYTKDALARYLGGILYEATGDLSNAFVAYRLALEAFESYHTSYGTAVPDLVRQDLLRVSEALGLNQEHQEYRQAFPCLTWQSEAATPADGALGSDGRHHCDRHQGLGGSSGEDNGEGGGPLGLEICPRGSRAGRGAWRNRGQGRRKGCRCHRGGNGPHDCDRVRRS